MPSLQVQAFCAWVAEVGGTTKAAALAGCSIAYVSNIKMGRRKPGRALAAKIAQLAPHVPVSGWD